ncbi:DUF4145 domain-containing protein [Clostridium hydrogenum]|uniref:DUF4145 domain-containing protein n=1 Tax=Clostridium hydrogenum TaxID=2855764 RepID=UPI001F44BAEC|nr:DUF4145 domain-containing protein [Clostridium hydrogenum]
MESDVFSYLNKNYRYLNNYVRELDEIVFTSPHSAIIKGKSFTENLTKEICKLEGYCLLNTITQDERLKKLESEGVLKGKIYRIFNKVRRIRATGAHDDEEKELEKALNMHRNIYNITCWFVKNYINCEFEADPYKYPIPPKNSNIEMASNLIKKMSKKTQETQETNKSYEKMINDLNMNEKAQDIFQNFIIESIIDNKEIDKKCLVQEFSKIQESLK